MSESDPTSLSRYHMSGLKALADWRGSPRSGFATISRSLPTL
jgi:hypothetical protein